MENNTVTLADSRKLGYAAYGHPEGECILYFHGSPSCRIHPTTALAHKYAQEMDGVSFRMIAVERPGYGLSSPVDDYSLSAWVRDVTEFVDALNITRFRVLGTSGGGPFALAVAHSLPHRVTKVAIQSGTGPLNAPGLIEALSPAMQRIFVSAHHAPTHVEGFIRHLSSNVESFVQAQKSELTAADRQVLTDELIQIMTDCLKESTRNPAGYLTDARILARAWEVPIEQIRIPVHLWYSDTDQSVPLVHGEYLASTIPTAELTSLSGYTHLGAAISCLQDAITYLIS